MTSELERFAHLSQREYERLVKKASIKFKGPTLGAMWKMTNQHDYPLTWHLILKRLALIHARVTLNGGDTSWTECLLKVATERKNRALKRAKRVRSKRKKALIVHRFEERAAKRRAKELERSAGIPDLRGAVSK